MTARVAPDRPPVRETTLANGLKVLIQEVHTAPLASVWCWYKVGSGDEALGQTGISHWVEHMNFKGTTKIPREQVKGIIERYGGSWNGYTWLDQTTYLETATRDALDQMLFIESERMAHGLYLPEDCESERTVIISELQGGENEPEQLLEIELTAAAFKAHPYHHPTIGWLADLERMTRDDLYGHYRRYYVPNNATLVVVGDVETADVLRRADHHFGSIEPGTLVPAVRTAEPGQVGERRVKIVKEGTAAYLKIACHAPALADPDFFRMLILDAVLAGAKGLNLWSSFRTSPPQRSARLYRALVDRRLASSVGGAMLPTRDPFLYTLSMTATEGTPLAALEEAAAAEIDRVAREGITAEELRKAKAQLRARLVFENDSVTNLAHQLGYFETIASWRLTETALASIEGASVPEVNAAATRYLRPSNRTVGWFEPIPAGSPTEMISPTGPTSAPAGEESR
jgi:zinc protease